MGRQIAREPPFSTCTQLLRVRRLCRSEISLDALQLLTELYPQGLQCPNVNGQLPLHRALDQNPPHQEAIQFMLEAFPGAAKVSAV